MSVKTYRGIPYHLWNPFTVMDEYLPLVGIGPMVITRGEGAYVFNDHGQRYINGFSSLWNVAIGHGRDELVEAAAAQMRELAFASCFRQVHPRAIELAAKLVEITSGKFQHVYLGSNGSEATETALKMARQYHKQSPNTNDQGRFKIISLKGSYHGVSYGAISTSGQKSDAAKYGPLLPGFLQIDPPYCYRCPYGKTEYPECGLECAQALERTIKSEGSDSVAAFILEPIMGAGGVIKPPAEFYKYVGEICQQFGLLFIVDEVTTGFGRTGKLFASEDWTPSPDILCVGKAISSGYLPLSATLATDTIYQRFNGSGKQFEHGSTASGHPVCAAVGLANIDIILNENLAENAAKIGSYLLSGFRKIAEKRKQVGNVRGQGLMIGLELVTDREKKTHFTDKETFDVILDCASMGLLSYYTKNVLGLFPPLIIDTDIADQILTIIDKALGTGLTASIARKARLAKMYATGKLT
jgi:adenosylmethionine-8-amino-7-oxononanoate aminotransferase